MKDFVVGAVFYLTALLLFGWRGEVADFSGIHFRCLWLVSVWGVEGFGLIGRWRMAPQGSHIPKYELL